jgi:hypothetical protein
VTASAPNRTVSAVSLATTAVVVLVMAVWGYHKLTAPVPDDPTTVSSVPAKARQSCPAGQVATVVDFVRRREVTVSVYNAGKKSGRARSTLDKLESAGFQPGAIGNAPEGTTVARAEVHATAADATKAQLVALALGHGTPVNIAGTEEDLGPGINVFIGDKFNRLDSGAPLRLRLPHARIDCN